MRKEKKRTWVFSIDLWASKMAFGQSALVVIHKYCTFLERYVFLVENQILQIKNPLAFNRKFIIRLVILFLRKILHILKI